MQRVRVVRELQRSSSCVVLQNITPELYSERFLKYLPSEERLPNLGPLQGNMLAEVASVGERELGLTATARTAELPLSSKAKVRGNK